MIDETAARLRTYSSNIGRYQRLLDSQLSDDERRFIERRLSEERSAMQKLTRGSALPVSVQAAIEAGIESSSSDGQQH